MRILLTCGHRNNGLWLTRRFAREGHEVIVCDSRPLAFGMKSRYASAFELLPEPSDPTYGDALLSMVRRVRPDALFPLGREGQVSQRRPELERETGVLVADPEAHRALLDKVRTFELCSQFGILHPRVLGTEPRIVAGSLTDHVDDDTPVAVIKPRWDVGAGGGVTFLTGRENVQDLWTGLVKRFGPLVATAYVAGPVDAQFAVKMLFDQSSELIEFFVLQKLRQWPPQSGITAAARSVHQMSLVTQMLPLFRHLRWRGPVEVELKYDAEEGEASVLEINPRLSGTLSFSVLAGVDVPGSILRACSGKSTPRPLRPYYPRGLYYWNPLPWTRSVLRDLRSPERIRRAIHDLPMPLARRPVGNPYSIRDPGALVGKIGLQLSEAMQRRSRFADREAAVSPPRSRPGSRTGRPTPT